MHAEDAAPAYQEVDKLQSMGIAAADISKLKAGGCHTVRSEPCCDTRLTHLIAGRQHRDADQEGADVTK